MKVSPENRKKIWYMLCFFALGIIDQRRGSADGAVQMAAVNCVGLVLAATLLPSIRFRVLRQKAYVCWTVFALILGVAAIVWGRTHWLYQGQWIIGVLNVAVWGYFVIYIIREWENTEGPLRIRQPFFWCIGGMFLWMLLSEHRDLLTLWMLLIFGGFYLIGIPKGNREPFFHGMLNGVILWFFVQQGAAFMFRPYDYVRYRSMYTSPPPASMFYMVIYCAFLCKWIWVKQQKKSRFWECFYFLMAVGNIAFMIFTGGRSAQLGAVVTTVVIYVLYDMIWNKSFYAWLKHMILFAGSIVLMIPLVYGAMRYLPPLFHHPIWFYNEYNEGRSVLSEDSWDSEKYVTFNEAVETNIGRVFQAVGINICETGELKPENPFVLKAYAVEEIILGSSPENPVVLSDGAGENSIKIRKEIFKYYLSRLNLWGHKSAETIFYIKGFNCSHAHNMLIQMLFIYGIPAGILFLAVTVYSLIYFIVYMAGRPRDMRWVCAAFFTAVFFYGMSEMPLLQGTISWVLIYLLLYFAGENSLTIK